MTAEQSFVVGCGAAILLAALIIWPAYFVIKRLGKKAIKYYLKQRNGASRKS